MSAAALMATDAPKAEADAASGAAVKPVLIPDPLA